MINRFHEIPDKGNIQDAAAECQAIFGMNMSKFGGLEQTSKFGS